MLAALRRPQRRRRGTRACDGSAPHYFVTSTSRRATRFWPPGDYLLKLIAGPGASYVPLTVRDDQSHAPVLVVNAVTTWQAYNDWGGYDLYNGPRDDPKLRSSIVSFDRPYRGSGADEFISNELGLITVVE